MNSNKFNSYNEFIPPLPPSEEGAGGRRQKLAIIKYNAGNIRSVLFALERIGYTATVTDNPDEIITADKVIFPGVGEAGSAMKYLEERELDKLIFSLKQPVLGICLGMQLLCQHSEESDTECIGVFDETVKKFNGNIRNYKIPQIGWNTINDLQTPLFKYVTENCYCYFVHGYYVSAGKHSIATTNYIQPYCSAINKNNFYGVQFHPEKSAAAGEKILNNFLTL